MFTWALVKSPKSRVAAGSREQTRPPPDHRSFAAELAKGSGGLPGAARGVD